MMTLIDIKAEISKGTATETIIKMLSVYISAHPSDDEALTLRGQKYWSLNNRSAAINDYLAAIRINPESKARMLMKTTYEILNFYNKDLYNP